MKETSSIGRVQRVLVGLFVGVVFVSSCGGENYAATFESLLEKIEISESRLETGIDIYSSANDKFINCIGANKPNAWLCENERLVLSNAYSDVMDSWNFAFDKAEMQAIRLPSSGSELSIARNAYVDHLSAWTDYLSAVSVSLPDSMFSSRLASQLLMWAESSLDDKEIKETFKLACSGLGNAQPNDSDIFKSRIIDICDD